MKAMIALALAAMQADAPDELVVRPGEAVPATVAGHPAQLQVESGRLDRLTLDPAFVAKHAIKPALIMGRAELSVAGRREFKGRNRSLAFTVAGRTREGRAYWFPDAAPIPGRDGSVGPWGLPQTRVTFALAAAHAGEVVERAPLFGDADGSGYTAVTLGGRPVAISLEPTSGDAYPVASAAAGALLAKLHGGTVSGASWDVDVLMGVMRPVRLLTLATPVAIGPLRITRLAVRVPDRIDASGRGTLIAEAGIAEAGAALDPAETVVVSGRAKGPPPSYVIGIPRAALGDCSRVTFDKRARTIELACRAAR